MRKLFYFLIPLIAFGFFSCRKSSDNFTIKQYDANQIQTYIAQNGLTGMKPDTSSGDTTGIYYQIISPGTGSVIDYPTLISYTYSYRTFDGAYSTTDTIVNHTNTYLGHVVPSAVQISLKNILKRKGGKIRLLIPSRLAFGTNGYFTGGVTINGNQCLDYTVTLVDNDPILDATGHPIYSINPTNSAIKGDIITYQTAYDDLSISRYIKANNLQGYQQMTSVSGYKYYMKVVTPATGTDPITLSSTVGVTYGAILINGVNGVDGINGTLFDSEVTTDGTAATSFTLYDVVDGFSDALTHAHPGEVFSVIMPSALGYGDTPNTSGSVTIPAFSCLRFDVTVVSVTN